MKFIEELGVKWISIKKKPPEINTWVLVFAHTTDPDIDCDPQIFVAIRGSRDSREDEYDCAHGDGYIAEEFEITHWMPLPEPPKLPRRSPVFSTVVSLRIIISQPSR